MNNYAIVSEKDKIFHVHEIPTNQIIESYSSRKDANKLYKRLRSGGVFAGNSPPFFLNKDFKRVYNKLFLTN